MQPDIIHPFWDIYTCKTYVPGSVIFIHVCLVWFILVWLHFATNLDNFIVFCMISIYPWRCNVLFLLPWHTWLPFDISLIRISPGCSLNYKIPVVQWIEIFLPMCTNHPFLAYLALVLGWISHTSSRFLISNIEHIFLLLSLLHFPAFFSFCHSELDLSGLAPILLDCFSDCIVRSFSPTNSLGSLEQTYLYSSSSFLVSLLLLQYRWN